MLVYLCVFAAGLAAWVGTREGRRKTGDLLATTARAAWARQATVLAATAFWMVLAFLAETAVIYVQTAGQATWGGPPLWPVAVGVVCTFAACAIGFTAGTLFPGRFTAPIVAVAVFVLEFVGFKAAADTVRLHRPSGGGTYALLTPGQGLPPYIEAGVFYRVPPDVSIAQLMFMGGLLLVAAGLLALAPAAPGARRPWPVPRRPSQGAGGGRGGRRRRRRGRLRDRVLAGRHRAATSSVTGWEIPALHDAASDRPVPYTPVCTGGRVPGLHPPGLRRLPGRDDGGAPTRPRPRSRGCRALRSGPSWRSATRCPPPRARPRSTPTRDPDGDVGGSWFGRARRAR